jgi:hypothetical protein
MNSKNWILALCLGLLVIGGALEVTAQQPTPQAPATPQTETAPAPDRTPTQPAPENPPAQTPTPRTEYGGQPAPAPPTGSQIDTRPATNGESRSLFGIDPTVAVIIGAALLVIIVISLVAMSRRTDTSTSTRNVDTEVRRTTTRHQI